MFDNCLPNEDYAVPANFTLSEFLEMFGNEIGQNLRKELQEISNKKINWIDCFYENGYIIDIKIGYSEEKND